MHTIVLELTDSEYKKIKDISNEKNIEESIMKIIREKINYIPLNSNFKYHLESKSIYNFNNTKIKLTRIEEELFFYLITFSINNTDAYVDIEQIAKDVWKKNNTSIFSIRNKIAAIRDKTYREIIKSKNNHGYRINITKFHD